MRDPVKSIFGLFRFLFFFAALPSKSTAMVMAGRSVYLATLLFLGKLEQAVKQYFVHILSLVTDNILDKLKISDFNATSLSNFSTLYTT